MNKLESLKKIAENATPGPWTFNIALYTDARIWIDSLDTGLFLKAEKGALHGKMGELSKHIATFNPETVLKLIEVIEAQRKSLDTITWYKRMKGLEGPDGIAEHGLKDINKLIEQIEVPE